MNASVNEGDKAPAFDLENDGGGRSTLREAVGSAGKDGMGKWLVLYFYPKDSTPGCTREAEGFTAAKRKLAALGALVMGVSKDSIKSHCTFRDKYSLGIPLLSDPDLAVHRAYGAYGEKTMYGKKVMGTIRSTFLISPEGRVARAWRGVKVDGHVDAVLDAIREAKEGSPATGARAKAKTKG
jgi:peroxiredoxin Q/BCP